MANNYEMDNGSRLLKIGIEASDLLEEEERGRKGRPAAPSKQKAPPASPACHYQYQPQQALVYQMMNPISSSEAKITRYDAVKLHDGLPIMDYPKRESAATMAC